ncbi:MAG: thiazole synthase [Elusimicrobiota bacterium]
MLKIGDKELKSRLFVGTGKFYSYEIMRDAITASGADVVTVALRRVDISARENDILKFINKDVQLMPNTSGARNADEAVRIARLCRAVTNASWIKLEVVPDPVYLLPDPIETLKAAEILVKDGFTVLPYINADPVLAKYLEEAGCATVMPLAAPIGTNKGLKTIDMLKIIIEMSNIPVIVDAGIGRPSDAMAAMEIGADAVLVNTAIAVAHDPVKMAGAFKDAVIAGRKAFEAGLGKVSEKAEASSPLTGFLNKGF